MTAQSKDWMTPSAQCIVLYGLWGFFSKLGGKLGLDAAQESLAQKIGLFVTLPFLGMISGAGSSSAPTAGPSVPLYSRPPAAILASILSGASSCVASLYYSKAMEAGDGGTVSAVTACYPPVTMILGAIFMGEVILKFVGWNQPCNFFFHSRKLHRTSLSAWFSPC
jgi:uncharacterized membrane protein